MVRRRPPDDCGVIGGSTPVVAFGDPRNVRLATIGLNPSKIEFLVGKTSAFLSEEHRRLATLKSLNAHATDELDQRQVEQVVKDCANYFQRNPYKWFKNLDTIIQGAFGTEWSYYNKTVCHLDLVQWATDPVWSGLSKIQKDKLIGDGRVHLDEQLTTEKIKVVIVNGRSVWNELTNLNDFKPGESETGYFSANRTRYTRVRGERSGVHFFGWTCNIPTQHGTMDQQLWTDLSDWLQKVAAPHLVSND